MISSTFKAVSSIARCVSTCVIQQQRLNSTLFSHIKNHPDIVKSTNKLLQNESLNRNVGHNFHTTSRTLKIEYFKPSVWKRAHKHGFERFLSKQGLKEVMWRRYLKGRHTIVRVDRFMNYPVISPKAQKQLPMLRKGLHKFYPHQRQVPVWKKP